MKANPRLETSDAEAVALSLLSELDYSETSLPLKTELYIALIVEALEQLGCRIRTAPEGTSLP
ncbi:hypothetical protein D6C89_07594 [Aureobasidium pullulans]|nr:hypothetical protein D6C89_07594 [Aureobasidium pullulans]